MAETVAFNADIQQLMFLIVFTFYSNKGLNGIKLALKVLNGYYAKVGKAHGSSDGVSVNIIDGLEVGESDFSKGFAEIEFKEETAAAVFEYVTKEKAMQYSTKEKEVEYKTKVSVYLGNEVAEYSEAKHRCRPSRTRCSSTGGVS